MATELRTTACVMDCPDACALEVSVSDGRVERISPGKGHPDTAGFICTKVSRFDRRLYHEDRLLHPERRSGPKGSGRYTRISWDEAIGEITDRFSAIGREFGPEAILPYSYGGSNGKLSDGLLDSLYFAKLGASRLAKTICAAPTSLVASGMYGKMPGVPFSDYPLARCIVIWGANPKASNIHLVPYLKQAKREGAYVVVVDPTKNFSAQEVDLHVQVMPGADLPLALALIKIWADGGKVDTAFLEQHADGSHVLLEAAEDWTADRAAVASGVPAAIIREFADVYADAQPAVIRCGWGPERNRNGGQAVAAIMAMPALLGKFGVRGGGYTMSNSGVVEDKPVFEMPPWNTRIVNMTQLGKALTGAIDPQLRGLFVYNSNPVATTPDQNRIIEGFSREELFTVVLDQVRTDTAALADIVLPATTFLEHWDTRVGYGSNVLLGARPVIPAAGEARSNHDVFAALGRAMGWDDEPFGWDQETSFEKLTMAVSLDGAPADVDRLKSGGVQPVFSAPPVQLGTVFPRTSDGKIHLAPAALGDSPYAYDPIEDSQHPLALISPSSRKMISSTFGEFNYPELFVDMHADDAATRRIGDGDRVRVFNELGEVRCRARVRGKVRAGVVSMPKGAWRKSSLNGMTSTALTPATINVVGGAACFNDARVEVALEEARLPPTD